MFVICDIKYLIQWLEKKFQSILLKLGRHDLCVGIATQNAVSLGHCVFGIASTCKNCRHNRKSDVPFQKGTGRIKPFVCVAL